MRSSLTSTKNGEGMASKRPRNDSETTSKRLRNSLGSGAGKTYNSEEFDGFASMKRPGRGAGLDPPVICLKQTIEH